MQSLRKDKAWCLSAAFQIRSSHWECRIEEVCARIDELGESLSVPITNGIV